SKPPPARHRPGARSARRGDVPPFYRRPALERRTIMLFSSWLRSWKRFAPAPRRRTQTSPRRTVTPRRSFVPRLDVLEDRTVPSGLHDGLYIGDQGSLRDHTDATVQRSDAATGALPASLVAADSGGLNSNPGTDNRAPDLDAFPNLQVPAGNKVAFHAYAE